MKLCVPTHNTIELNLFKCLQTKAVYPAKISFKNEEKIFSDKNSRGYIASQTYTARNVKESPSGRSVEI